MYKITVYTDGSALANFTQCALRRRTLTVIFIFEIAAIAAICLVLLILESRRRPKYPETKPDPPQRISKRPGRCKRRPKGQTGRKHPKGKRKEV